MQVEVVRKEGLKRELNIEVPTEVVNETYAKIYEQYRKQAKIKGFRPGKTPLSIIRSRFKHEVTAELIEELVRKYYGEAVLEKKLEVVGDPVLSSVDVDEGRPFKFTIGFEVMPELERAAFEGMTVARSEINIADADVDKVMEDIRQGSAELRTVARAAGGNDTVFCDLEIKEAEAGLYDEKLYKNQEFDLSSNVTDDEFREKLTGAASGDTREVTIAYPSDYINPKFAGRKVVFGVTVREVKEKILPELNDEFARSTGEVQTLLELRLNVRKQLETEARIDQIRAERRSVMEQLVDKNPVDAPESMVGSYLDNVVADFQKNNVPFEEKELRDRYRPAALRAIRWFLLFHRLAVQEKVEVSGEDTENWIKRFADKYRMEVPKAKEILGQSNRTGEIKDSILEEKVIDFLMSRAEVTTGKG